MSLEYCIKCGTTPHKPQRCRDCHAWGRNYSMGRNAWGYRWNHDPGCRYFQPRYYGEAEQDKHREAFGGKPWGDEYCPTTGEYSLECPHCWEIADWDAGEQEFA